jgi:hypothetical protein
VPASKATSVLPVPPRAWERAVGTRIAARTRPARLERGVLHVVAASSAWAQELSLLGETIATRLREDGLSVTSLRFQVGKVEAPERLAPREPPRDMPPPAPLPPSLRDALVRVDDPALREVLTSAARASLGWEAERQRVLAARQAQPTRLPRPRRRG